MAGTIESIETSHGGGMVIVKIMTEYGQFSSNDIMQGDTISRDLKKGSAVYKALADMSAGDAVSFNAKAIAPEKNMFSEEDSVCGDSWVALFTSVAKK